MNTNCSCDKCIPPLLPNIYIYIYIYIKELNVIFIVTTLLLSHISKVFKSTSVQFGLCRSTLVNLIRFSPLGSIWSTSVYNDSIWSISVHFGQFGSLRSISDHFGLIGLFRSTLVNLVYFSPLWSIFVYLGSFGPLGFEWFTLVYFSSFWSIRFT